MEKNIKWHEEQITSLRRNYEIVHNTILRLEKENEEGEEKIKEHMDMIAKLEVNQCEYQSKLLECRTCPGGTNNGKECNRYKVHKATEIADELEEYFGHAPGFKDLPTLLKILSPSSTAKHADFQVARRYVTEIRRILKGETNADSKNQDA